MEIKPLHNSRSVFLVFFSTSLPSCISSQTPGSGRSTLFSFLPFPTIIPSPHSFLFFPFNLCSFEVSVFCPNQPFITLHCSHLLNNLMVTFPYSLRLWQLADSVLLHPKLFMIIACASMWKNKSSGLDLQFLDHLISSDLPLSSAIHCNSASSKIMKPLVPF